MKIVAFGAQQAVKSIGVGNANPQRGPLKEALKSLLIAFVLQAMAVGVANAELVVVVDIVEIDVGTRLGIRVNEFGLLFKVLK